jgi:N-formylglutamate deformylase
MTPPELPRDHTVAGVLRLVGPRAEPIPLVFDSPHSGTLWPADFRPAAPEEVVRRTQDSFVDELFGHAPAVGASLLAGLFPRIYVDPNRALDDLDPELLAAPWPMPLAPGEKTDLGKGLIWRMAAPGLPVYDRRLQVAEVRLRIERYWQAYHDVLARTLGRHEAAFGGYWLVNCHSMKSTSTAMDKEGPGIARVDVVLSDRDGTSCEPGFLEAAAEHLRGQGLSVAINEPFKGAEIVRRHGRPAAGRHALQIELNRRLYLDEVRLERGPGYAACRALVDGLVEKLADHVRGRCAASPAGARAP